MEIFRCKNRCWQIEMCLCKLWSVFYVSRFTLLDMHPKCQWIFNLFSALAFVLRLWIVSFEQVTSVLNINSIPNTNNKIIFIKMGILTIFPLFICNHTSYILNLTNGNCKSFTFSFLLLSFFAVIFHSMMTWSRINFSWCIQTEHVHLYVCCFHKITSECIYERMNRCVQHHANNPYQWFNDSMVQCTNYLCLHQFEHRRSF